MKGYRRAVIFTDSRSACEMLLKLREIEDNFLLGGIYKELLEITGDVCKIQWIPSLVGIQGNEIADQLVVNKSRERQSNCQGITAGDAVILSSHETWEEWNQAYKQISDEKGTWHYQLMERPGRKIWSKGLILSPDEVKVLNRIRSGHCLTKDRKAKWGWETDELCEWCEIPEDLKHILYDCPRYNQSRSKFPALEYMKPLEIILQEGCEEEMKQIVKFLKANDIHI